MNSRNMQICSVVFALCTMFALSNRCFAQPVSQHNSAEVVLSLDGKGDFGPQTPGTHTAGWQEALNYCVAHGRDLHVQGGYGGQQVYNIQDTIHVPPAQDFRIDGGVYVLNWVGRADQDLMDIDSTMNCEYHFGLMVYGGTRAGLRVKPEVPVPVDHFPVCVETHIEMEGLADPQPFIRGERRSGDGLVLDGSKASIVHSEFRLASVINFHTCIRTIAGVGYNHIVCPHLHTNSDHGTLFSDDDRFHANTLEFTTGVDQGAEDVTGIVLAGKWNRLELEQRESNRPFPPGKSLVLAGTAEGNQVNIVAPAVVDPAIMVTDAALIPTNQITWAGAPASIQNLRAVRGPFRYVQRLWPATFHISAGKYRRLTLVRGTNRIEYKQRNPEEILLSVGDTITLDVDSSVEITIVPVKVK